MSTPPRAGRLFVANCILLVTTSMVFATRGTMFLTASIELGPDQ